MTIRQLALTIFAVVLMGLPAEGQSTAELLQKGIYTQETVGDLDGAIKIYRQILNSTSQSRTYAAQAQYRLAQCLLKKGENDEAVKAFEKVVQDYPDQKELVSKARAYVPDESISTLLPVPWADDELSELRIKLPGGLEIGTLITSIEPDDANPRNSVLWYRTYVEGSPEQWSRTDVDRNSMRPIRAATRISLLGDYRTDYETGQARVESQGKEPRVVALDGPVFDNQEFIFLSRRLPLALGFKKSISVLAAGGTVIKINVAVIAMEDVQVPAGKFHCYKLELAGFDQTFWIGADAPRPLVKVETHGQTVELSNLRKLDRSPLVYQDAKIDLSFTASAGWIAKPEDLPAKDETRVFMLDPESKASLLVWAKEQKTMKSEIVKQLRAGLDERVERRSKMLKDYRIRPESIQTRQIGGNQVLSAVAEFLQGQQKMVEYLTWVRSENVNSLFFATVPASDLDEFRKRLDPVLETVKIK